MIRSMCKINRKKKRKNESRVAKHSLQRALWLLRHLIVSQMPCYYIAWHGMLQLTLLTLLINSNVIDWLDETSVDIHRQIVNQYLIFVGFNLFNATNFQQTWTNHSKAFELWMSYKTTFYEPNKAKNVLFYWREKGKVPLQLITANHSNHSLYWNSSLLS